MSNKTSNSLILAISLCWLVTFLYVHEHMKRKQAELVASIYADCCRNMYDNYGDPDSLYNYYINVAIEEGIDKQEFKSYYFCY